MDFRIDMNFCRRCGSKLQPKDQAFAFVCSHGHNIFYNAGTGSILALFNKQGQLLVVERAVEAKGMWDLPGGFCNADESLEEALEREVREEVELEPTQYTDPEYLGSGTNTYHFGSEVVPVIATVFRAYLKEDVRPKASSDAAKVWFADLDTLDLEKLYSATSRRVLAKLRDL